MKNNLFVMATLAVVLAFSMAVVGCDDGSGNNNGGGTAETVEYTSYAGDNTYILKITQDTSRAAYSPRSGDAYVLTIKVTATGATVATSSGTVSSASGGTLTLKSGEAEFSVTISSSGTMTAITVSGGGAIPGTTVAAPGTGMTADSGNNQDGNGNDTNPLAGTRWGYEFTRAEYAQEYEASDATLAAAGVPATWFFGFSFNANMTFTLSESGPLDEEDSEGNVWWEWEDEEWTGTYTISGSTVNLLFNTGEEWTATFSEDILTCMGMPLPKM